MGYEIEMRRNATGEVRRIAIHLPWDDDECDLFLWAEGNFSCDGNRLKFWTDWGRVEPQESVAEMAVGEHCCDSRHFTITKAILPDGREVEIDDPDAALSPSARDPR